MTTPPQSIFQKEIHPFKQAAFALVLNIIAILIVQGVSSGEEMVDKGVRSWEASFSILLAFMLFNSIFSFLVVAALGGVLAHYVSGVSMDNAGSFRWLYIVFTFTYLIFISIVNLMRKLMDIAKKQDARLRGED